MEEGGARSGFHGGSIQTDGRASARVPEVGAGQEDSRDRQVFPVGSGGSYEETVTVEGCSPSVLSWGLGLTQIPRYVHQAPLHTEVTLPAQKGKFLKAK